MEHNVEIRRLLDIMPASGRMMTKIVSKPAQTKVIDSDFPLPFTKYRPIYINFDLWIKLTKPQRDLTLLHQVSWLISIKWLQPNINQGIVILGLLGGIFETTQLDIVGIAVSGGLTALAAARIWQNNKSQNSLLNADLDAVKIAQRRGYSEAEAAENLLTAITTIAQIEGRSGLEFSELLRIQNLQAIANLHNQ
ncbi:DUF3318 domain-containing protein [Anabaena sp. FACHB-1237]|uniref:DUF3318 domain-containing protein n=1 Tax=Anabaena sp. FACHB-1237 TaxID=2692769 RepID=UPI0016816BD0|nr:DUF3318 domain-containing protein [Anabaena sp. FACHB-1237]MBD2137703.1 DUF3318 domain-containing protein [Anabaena sp. FACHB-1237]